MFAEKELSALERVYLDHYLKGATIHKRTWWRRLLRLPARITFETAINFRSNEQ